MEQLRRYPSGYFNPRSSCEERRSQGSSGAKYTIFQSTLLMRGATRDAGADVCKSIISIHAPHARSDLSFVAIVVFESTFQSTLLMRGATKKHSMFQDVYKISIHAPHARSDWLAMRWISAATPFQSTLLMRGATGQPSAPSAPPRNFNPRSSCEERLSMRQPPRRPMPFQSTLLMRGATRQDDSLHEHSRFQSTLLMRGATWPCLQPCRPTYFNPRSSCEERPSQRM